MSIKKNDGRAQMYADARRTLAEAISFTPNERLAKLHAERDALLITRSRQIEAARCAATTDGAAERATLRIEALYAKELETINKDIEENERKLLGK